MLSCRIHNGNISIKHNLDKRNYELQAHFDPANTDQVDRYLDSELGNGQTIFHNTEMDGEITLDDQTTFYIKKSPGYLKIRFDKEKNSEEAFVKIRSVLEGVQW